MQAAKPKKKKKKGMKKHLIIMWGVGAVVLVGVLGYIFWKLRTESGKKVRPRALQGACVRKGARCGRLTRGAMHNQGTSKREEKRKKEKEIKKEKVLVEKVKLKEKKEEPPPPQDPSEARRARRQAMEERAKVAADNAFRYGGFCRPVPTAFLHEAHLTRLWCRHVRRGRCGLSGGQQGRTRIARGHL